MKILIIGGTRFMGYYAAEYALARGHEVTLFNRGKSAPDVFPAAEKIVGDRGQDIDLLRGRRWDGVIDTCGYVPRVVRKSASLLADSTNLYLFISSISVFSRFPADGADENGPLAVLADPSTEEITGESYGGLKVLCEGVVEETFQGRAAIVRPGLIVGPRDATDRFRYWVRRIAQGGEVLAPATPDNPVQFIDARDLGEWVVRMVEAGTTGVFNATGPAQPITMGDVLDACKSASRSDASFTWVDETFLLERQVAPWSELPLWVPADDSGLHRSKIDKALAAGLTFRPVADTVSATATWMATNPELSAPQGTLTPEKEAALLREWHLKQS